MSTPRPSVDPEPRWPGVAALLIAAGLNWLLPEDLSAGPGWLGVALVAVMAGAALLFKRWHVWIGYATTAAVTLELANAVVNLILDLVHHRGRPEQLLWAALIVWTMNIMIFASWYWRLDGGGPHERARREVYHGNAFLFPQMTMDPEARNGAGHQNWRPRFVDYLFLAFNTSTAFSPTDVPVLTAWAKLLMMLQSSISLATLAMVAARAVNIL